MSKKPKLFIASSSRAKILAHQLELSLNNRGIDARVWDIDNNSFHAGKSVLEGLLDAGRMYDFAAVILTQDDISMRSNDPSERLLNVPRDNCIFELGFFIGALDLNPQRCFFVSSVQANALPSDLKGYLYYKINEPEDWNDSQKSEDCIREASVKIADRVDKLSSLERLSKEDVRFSVISSEKLIELETIEKNLVENSEILIQALEPIETNLAFAKRVLRNMEKGVTYNYLFPAQDKSSARNIASMLRTITIANLDSKDSNIFSDWDELKEEEKLELMRENIEAIRQNLEKIKFQLFIHFVPHTICEEFCIHNANSLQHRIGYLRWLGKNYFLELDQMQARVKYDAYKSFMHSSQSTIFASNYFITLEQIERVLALKSRIEKMFPEKLVNDVNKAFFGT